MRTPMGALHLLAIACLVAMTNFASAADDPTWYVRKPTWHATLFASRDALATHLAAEAAREGLITDGKLQLGRWWATKALPAKQGVDTKHFPEEGLVPTSSEQEVAKLWSEQKGWRDGTVINLGGQNCVTYVFRTIQAKEAVKAPAWLGCDDRMSVWVNGKHIFTNPSNRGVAPNQDKIVLPLEQGDNALLIKVYNAGGAYGYYFHTKPGPAKANADHLATLWNLVGRDFPAEAKHTGWERRDNLWHFEWGEQALARLASNYHNRTPGNLRTHNPSEVKTEADLAPLRAAYYRGKEVAAVIAEVKTVNFKSLRLAIADLSESYPDTYGKKGYLARLAEYEKLLPAIEKDIAAGKPEAITKGAEIVAFQREALLANPLLDFDRIAVVRRRFGDRARGVNGSSIGAPAINSETNEDMPHTGWDNEIAVVSNLRGAPAVKVLYKPAGSLILRDTDVDFDGRRIMYSSIGAHDRWAVFEINADGTDPRQITPADLPDVDFFDSCYLPDGRVITCSTACYQGLPCINGGRPMVNLYLLDRAKDSISQLTFEQDSDWHPCVLHNGRVLYLRWEYSDIQHYFSRILFSCNPDGTNQMEYYGSGSYFPTAFKHARPCPGHPRKVVGIISGHHSVPETGRMAIIDPGLSRKYPLKFRPKTKEWGAPGSTVNIHGEVLPAEQTGFVQEIPGYGKPVVGNVYDGQGSGVYPNFVYPYPLSDRYILVSMKRDGGSLWGLYLVDVFDNMTLLLEEEGAGFFEAFPLCERPRPPVVPDRVIPGAKTASVYITDVHNGPGLAGIARGSVKRLRLFAYHFAYNHTGGHTSVGAESSWDIKRILGTVPVEADGSANFLIPANTPISIQPLDSEGRAVQIMRSWLVGKPGEAVSCGGCHENQNMASANRYTAAARRAPTPISPWYGPERPFSFKFEVQPVVEKYCVGCHDGSPRKDGKALLSFRDDGTAYHNLHPYVRRPGPESDLALTRPMEWHASTSPLVQMLEKGHHNVRLDREAWERIACWIDLNAPQRGSWRPPQWRGQDQTKRRLELAKRYAGVDADPEEMYTRLEKAFAERKPVEFVKPEPVNDPGPDGLQARGFPFTPEQARKLQGDAHQEIDLPNGQKIPLVRIPAGEFVMGSQAGYPDEAPRSVVGIKEPFWMGVCEVSNAQYAAFDPEHDTRYYDEHGKDQAVPGYIGNHDDQPVARISWQEAMAFCAWLSKRTGKAVTLPTEAQWEWAARAGSAEAFYYGGHDAPFAEYANLSDHTRLFTQTGWDGGSKVHVLRPYDPKHHFPLRDDRCDDKSMVTNYVGRYKPNAWGLRDMIGNVCEWTRSSYRPYPYQEAEGAPTERKVARGGSWDDRPKTATASIRFAYQPYQKVYNVGFRIIVAESAAGRTALGR